jgi:branched-chain amino acid transport system ATP-binding protein
MLEVSHLHAGYGHVPVLNDVNFHIHPGECVALLGSNGAGKTTTLSTISGLLKPTSGSIRFAGEDILADPAYRLIARGLVQVPEGRRIFPDLLVRENLAVGAHSRRPTAADFDRVYDLFPILRRRAGQKGGTLSGGEQQMLAVGRALMARPKLLMLDEPSLGLAPMIVEQLFETIRLLKAEITILLVEQNVHLVSFIVDRAYVLQKGRVVREGSGADLAHAEWVREAYLGTSMEPPHP